MYSDKTKWETESQKSVFTLEVLTCKQTLHPVWVKINETNQIKQLPPVQLGEVFFTTYTETIRR